ncbi:hypothetical protein [Lacinutrix sp. 5H-3-7-4]|uniref:hypothetical protein n=1 Tax=Lacinutrix sp. (strain 5H-3-7-4) TaxID=983544 RepID=UPI00020A3CA1|nr:hypothetical protein [Lacinutrix sp. 5H-3-7-4]AEH00557.1 membrane protein [Lacinutrix sp. 5H-3-7-4]
MHKILKIVLAVLGVAGIIFLARIVAAGDEAVKASAAAGDTSLIEPMAWIAYLVLAVIVALVLIFVVVNLFSSGETLKKTLMSVGAFVLVAVIAYVLAEGVETPMQDGKMLSESGSRWVGTGLYAFYILAIVSVVVMLGTGIKKMIK